MDSLEDLFQRCHERHHNPLSQQKSIIMPSFHKQDFHLTVFCAVGYPIEIEALIAANINCCPLKKMSKDEVFLSDTNIPTNDGSIIGPVPTVLYIGNNLGV